MIDVKFRAWDKEYSKMLEVVAIDFLGNERVHPHIYDENNHIRPLKDLVLLQYTGLKDKNATEIYAGDIVRVPIDTAFNMYGSYIVTWDKEYTGYYLKSISNKRGDIRTVSDYNAEVIGNIYKNTELVNS